MTAWVPRLRHAPNPRELEKLRDAAEELTEHAGRSPGHGGAFQKVYNVALLATVTLSGALAGVHLYKTLFPKHHEHGDGRERGHSRGG
jgi:hypothetical protein